jgi:glycosyltransferase involved in cell wall biosynthesis
MSNASNRLSVIICTWNRADPLERTLASLGLQKQVDLAAVEVIVVDNNSKDDTRQRVDRCAADWPPGSLCYAFEPRQGKQFALNRGIAMAHGELLAFTDDDILFDEGWLHAAQRVFADPAIDLAGGRTLLAWPEGGPPEWYADEMMAVVGGVDLGSTALLPAPPDYAPAGANLVARRTLFDRVGLFSESHFRHMDFEFGMRCQQAGVGVAYAPSLVVHAPVDAGCLSRRYFRRWSFKAGIARDGGAAAIGRGWPRVPRWIYRQALEDTLWLALRARAQPPAVAFTRELRLCRALGALGNAWHGWLRPASHDRWVQRYSQKQEDLY